MRLGVNGWRIHGRRTGVGRYLFNVLRHWENGNSGQFDEITFYTPQPLDRKELPLPTNIHERVLRPGKRMLVWENLLLGPMAKEDVMFCPSYSRPILGRGRFVVATHDAIQSVHPEIFPPSVRYFYNPLHAWSARHAALIITDSDAARHDIARSWGIPLSRIRVTYLAPAEMFGRVTDAEALRRIRERYLDEDVPFFLFVGKLSGRRSIPHLFEAFAEAKRRVSLPHKLLLVGLNIHNIDLQGLISKLGIQDSVRHCGFIPDEDLNLIYNAAEVFVMPSVYETSSLPVMEAQATGVPVICIDTAGMREITGGAAYYIPKLETTLLADAMLLLAREPRLRRELSERSLEVARRYSWKRCSAETMQVLEDAARL